jgi:hypothetical protein
VVYAPVECGVRRTWVAQVGPSARVHCDLPRKRPPFLGLYGELYHTDESLFVNKKDGLEFGLVQHSEDARHIRNSVREISDQASCFTNYKMALSMSLLVEHILS